MREEGFYWVKLGATNPPAVGEWASGRWFIPGDDEGWFEKDIRILSPRLRPPGEATNAASAEDMKLLEEAKRLTAELVGAEPLKPGDVTSKRGAVIVESFRRLVPQLAARLRDAHEEINMLNAYRSAWLELQEDHAGLVAACVEAEVGAATPLNEAAPECSDCGASFARPHKPGCAVIARKVLEGWRGPNPPIVSGKPNVEAAPGDLPSAIDTIRSIVQRLASLELQLTPTGPVPIVTVPETGTPGQVGHKVGSKWATVVERIERLETIVFRAPSDEQIQRQTETLEKATKVMLDKAGVTHGNSAKEPPCTCDAWYAPPEARRPHADDCPAKDLR